MSSHELILFGGSFDPFHLGHLEIIRQALTLTQAEQTPLVIMPTHQSPLKEKTGAAPQDRLNLIDLSLHWAQTQGLIAEKNKRRVQISSWELDRPAPSYTFDAVTHLRSKYGAACITMLLGSDNLKMLPQWFKWNELRPKVRLLVFKRKSELGQFPVERLEERDEVLPGEIPDISSTALRNALSNLPAKSLPTDWSKAIPPILSQGLAPDALAQIFAKHLYMPGNS